MACVIHLFRFTAGNESEGRSTDKYESRSHLSLSARASAAQGAETSLTVARARYAKHLEFATVI